MLECEEELRRAREHLTGEMLEVRQMAEVTQRQKLELTAQLEHAERDRDALAELYVRNEAESAERIKAILKEERAASRGQEAEREEARVQVTLKGKEADAVAEDLKRATDALSVQPRSWNRRRVS